MNKSIRNAGQRCQRLSQSFPKDNLVAGLLLLLFIFSCSPRSENSLKLLRSANAYSEKGKVVITAFKSMHYWGEEHRDLYREIRIYRLSCPDFVFGKDYEEYFSDLNFKDGECIFQGPLEPILGRKYRFVDEATETGAVYAYWIAASAGKPTGPLPVKIRDEQVWWPYHRVMERLEELQNQYPRLVKVEEIGKSVNRKPLLAVRIGHEKKAVALIGAIHAGESGPELIIPVVQKLLGQNSDLFRRISLVVIPSVNCDRRDKLAAGNPWYLRRNANNVDLNRNFPADWDHVDQTYGYMTSDPDAQTFRGPYAASEPETIAVMDYLRKNKPVAVFSFHCLASIAGETLGISKTGAENQEYVNRCSTFADLYWQGVASPFAEKQKIVPLCTSGSLPEWCYRELGIPAFDMEAPFDANDLARCAIDATDRELLAKYQDIHYRGFVELLTRTPDEVSNPQ